MHGEFLLILSQIRILNSNPLMCSDVSTNVVHRIVSYGVRIFLLPIHVIVSW
jgi:hypothetical protein